MTKKFFGLVICAFSFIWANSALKVKAANKGYYDVPKNHWASTAVKELVDEYQFMSGDPSGNFGGSRAISRYEFAKTISKMIEYYNQEIETDRKDLENIVGVMELFQNELKDLQGKAQLANSEVESQNQTIAELNELIVTVAEELGKVDGEPGQIESINSRLALAETKINKLDSRGLVVGTLVRGVVNDVKSIGRGVGSVADKARSVRLSRKKRDAAALIQETEDTLIEEDVSNLVPSQTEQPAVLETHSTITNQQQVPTQNSQPASDSKFKQYEQQLDGYYAGDNDNKNQIDYLELIEE